MRQIEKKGLKTCQQNFNKIKNTCVSYLGIFFVKICQNHLDIEKNKHLIFCRFQFFLWISETLIKFKEFISRQSEIIWDLQRFQNT